jgi:hypothetical protein
MLVFKIMQTMRLFSILLMFSVLLASCAHQPNLTSHDFKKRKYRPGLFVDQVKKNNHQADVLSEEDEDLKSPSAVKKELMSSHTDSIQILESHKESRTSYKARSQRKSSVQDETQESISLDQYAMADESFIVSKASSPRVRLRPEPAERKTHWGALAGFMTAVTAVVGFFFIYELALLLIPALVFSIIALRARSKSPDEYQNNGLALAALFLAAAFLTFLIVAIILLIIFFASFGV